MKNSNIDLGHIHFGIDGKALAMNPRLRQRLKLRELAILMEVVAANGIGKAALRLHVSQPVVSKAIASLERTFGVRLLDRTIQGVTLTEYGRAILKCGIAMFDDLKKGMEEVDFINDPTVGEVRVGCTEIEFTGIVSEVIYRLAPKYPRMKFNVVRVDQAAPYRELEARKVDFLITRLGGSPKDSHLDTELLYNESIVVAVGSQSIWARKRKVDLAELVNEPWLLPPPGSFVEEIIEEAFAVCGLNAPEPTFIGTSTDMRVALLSNGHFITVCPRGMLQILAKRLPIKALPIALPRKLRPVGITTLRGRSLTPVSHVFLDCAREVAKPLATAHQGFP